MAKRTVKAMKMNFFDAEWDNEGAVVSTNMKFMRKCPRCSAQLEAGTTHRCGNRLTDQLVPLPDPGKIPKSRKKGTK